MPIRRCGERVIKVGDELDQALRIGIELDRILEHAGHFLVDQAQLLDGSGRFDLLDEIQRTAGLNTEEVGIGHYPGQQIRIINHHQAVNIVLGHQENRLEEMIAAADRDQTGLHDIPHGKGADISDRSSNQIAQVAQGNDADRLLVLQRQ